MIVIPNGIDSERFRPDPIAGRRLRIEWGIPENAPLIGIVGRIEPMKDHSTFLEAAGIVARGSKAHFVCIGDGAPMYRREMEAKALATGCGDRIHWLGVRNDMPSAYTSLDILVSASVGEGFSNVIGEAMASGVRCVVTDVGDSARIVGTAGIVVPPGDPGKMARAILDLIDGNCRYLDDPREQVSKNFSRERMVTATASALRTLV
jgi:glycosyltransferase involved in cell wall biosynthesis